MNPPPSTRTEPARSRSSASRSESSSLRSVRTAGWSATIGGTAARAPVARTTTSASSRSPSVVSTPSPEADVTRTPRRRSMSRELISSSSVSRANAGSRSRVRTCLDSGGRSYGISSSSLRTVIVPSKPALRVSFAVRQPARPAPTTSSDRGSDRVMHTPLRVRPRLAPTPDVTSAAVPATVEGVVVTTSAPGESHDAAHQGVQVRCRDRHDDRCRGNRDHVHEHRAGRIVARRSGTPPCSRRRRRCAQRRDQREHPRAVRQPLTDDEHRAGPVAEP